MKSNLGFSLLEMLVAILIGSMVVLMGAGLYATFVKYSIRHQDLGRFIDHRSDLLEIGQHITLAGLGVADGILIAPNQLGQLRIERGNAQQIISQHQTLPSHTQRPSDQLSIHYTAPEDMWDCEGRLVLGSRQVRLGDGRLAMIDGQRVIERYFVQKEDDGTLALRCNAIHYVVDEIHRDGTRDKKGLGIAHQHAIIDEQNDARKVKRAWSPEGLGEKGSVLMSDIGGFWVRLSVQTNQGIQSVLLDEYRRHYPSVQPVAIELVLMSRGTAEAHQAPMSIFGQTQRLLVSPKQDWRIHRVYLTPINLRLGGKP